MAKKVFDAADLAAVERVLASGQLGYIGGTAAAEFERRAAERFGCRYAIAIHSAMAGLQLGLMASGVGEGDEVICDPIVPFGAYAVQYCHARPVFADVDEATHNMRPASLRERITACTKAIIVTHLWGLPAPMDEILSIAGEHHLPVIEDCAHALFAEYHGRPVGTLGTVGVCSFQQSKHLTTGDGGLLLTNDPYIAEQVQSMLRFGALAPRLSWNFRMNEVTAAVAGVQFSRADGPDGYVAQDRRAAQYYTEAVAGRGALAHAGGNGDGGVLGPGVNAYHIWAAAYEGERAGGVEQARFQEICGEEGAQASFGYLKAPVYLHASFSLTNAFGYDVWRGAGSPYRRGYCPVAEALIPRLVMIAISPRDESFHRENAAALARVLERLER